MKALKNNLSDLMVKSFYNMYNLVELILKIKSDDSLTLKESYLLLVTERLIETKDNTVSNIASELKISNPAASLAITSLVKKGYLKRTNEPSDRRIYIIELTEKAKIILEAQASFREQIIAEILTKLTMVDKVVLQNMLNKVDDFILKDFNRIKKDTKPLVKKEI